MLKGSLGFWRILGVGGFKVDLENVMEPFLVGGFNPSPKILVKLDENKTYLKPPPSFHVPWILWGTYCWCFRSLWVFSNETYKIDGFRNPKANHRLDAQNPVDNGINYQPHLFGWISAINSILTDSMITFIHVEIVMKVQNYNMTVYTRHIKKTSVQISWHKSLNFANIPT